MYVTLAQTQNQTWSLLTAQIQNKLLQLRRLINAIRILLPISVLNLLTVATNISWLGFSYNQNS